MWVFWLVGCFCPPLDIYSFALGLWLSLQHAYEQHILAKRWECKKGGSTGLLADWSVSTQTSGPVFPSVIPKKQQNLLFLAQSMKLCVCVLGGEGS